MSAFHGLLHSTPGGAEKADQQTATCRAWIVAHALGEPAEVWLWRQVTSCAGYGRWSSAGHTRTGMSIRLMKMRSPSSPSPRGRQKEGEDGCTGCVVCRG